MLNMNEQSDQYKNGHFTWFIGVVKDIDDPKNLNRVKVMAYGYYDGVEKVSQLPWATVMMPTTSASVKGSGGNHHLQAEVKNIFGKITEAGSWVVGFFRDGPSAQDPVVIGSIATQTDDVQDIPSGSSTTNKVHHTKAGHKIEFENKEGDEKITVQHAKGATITIDKDNNVSIANGGNTNITSSGAITLTSAKKTTII